MNDRSIDSLQDLRTRQLEPLGRRIRALRREAGLSQAELAARVTRVARQEVSMMENGRFAGSILKVAAVVDYLRYQLSVSPYRYPTLDEIDVLFEDDDD